MNRTMGNGKQVKITKEGLEALKNELDTLVGVKRPKLVDRLSNARSQGDLSENADYQSAREELEFLDGRIEELTELVRSASIVAKTSKASGVDVGTKITVKFNGAKHIYEMVGEWEADPMNKRISPESPLGKALYGKKVGELAEVEAPAGKLTYEILAIE